MSVFVYMAVDKNKPNENFIFSWRDDDSKTDTEAVQKAKLLMPESSFTTGRFPPSNCFKLLRKNTAFAH